MIQIRIQKEELVFWILYVFFSILHSRVLDDESFQNFQHGGLFLYVVECGIAVKLHTVSFGREFDPLCALSGYFFVPFCRTSVLQVD